MTDATISPTITGPSITSTALVVTDRPGRYAKQLTSHMSRKVQTNWDDEANTGDITFDGAACQLVAQPEGLALALTASPELVERFEGVVGSHLVRFGKRDELTVAWTRSDGTEGTTHVHDGDDAH